MSTDNVIPFVSKEDGIRILYSVVILSLARMIHSGAINPETITRKQFLDFLSELGTSHENALEVHVTRIEDEMRFIAYCIAAGEAKSGIVLLFTLLEGEINLLIRVHLRIQGFSPNAITDALRGTDFDTKIDVLLPLLQVTVPERMRNTALQCKAIRNLVVHNKATPNIMAGIDDKPSDAEVASNRAKSFFAQNSIERLQHDLQEFINNGIYESKSIQLGTQLFDKYF